MEAELKAEAKKRQIRKRADFVKEDYPEQNKGTQEEELRIQGVAVGVYHKFGKADVEDENDDE